MKAITITAATLFLLPVMALANECKMHDNATINGNFNSTETDPTVVQGKLDELINTLNELAKKTGVEKLELTQKSYNVNVQYNNNQYNNAAKSNQQYNVNENLGFRVVPADKAATFLVQAAKLGYQFNLSVYSNPDCNNSLPLPPPPLPIMPPPAAINHK